MREPARIAANILGVVLAVCALIGVTITQQQADAIELVLAAVIPIVLSSGVGEWIRSRVSPAGPPRRSPDE